MPHLTAAQVRARRLVRQGLAAAVAQPTPAGVVRAMSGAHAQVPSAAEISVAVRLPGSTRETVRAALAAGDLTRTFGPRGTIHLLPTADLGHWLSALAAVPRASPFDPTIQLDPEQTDQVVAAVDTALRDDELSVDELDEAVVDAVGAWAGDLVMPAFQGLWPRWRQVITVAAHRGALVFGAGRGRRPTYAHPTRADPDFALADPGDAVAWLLRQYLTTFGPATPGDLARWLATSEGWTTSLFEEQADSIERVTTPIRPGWVVAGDTEPPPAVHGVWLLPYFDALAVGYQPREEMFVGRAAERALARTQAGNYPVVVVDGIVRGVWHQRRSGRRLHVTVETWVDLSPARRRALEAQVERLGEIVDAAPSLTLGEVGVGPHA